MQKPRTHRANAKRNARPGRSSGKQTSATTAPSPAGFTVDEALAYPFPYALTVAPASNRVAWLCNHRGARNIWIADGPGFAGRQVTRYAGDDGTQIACLRLTPNGQTAVYARRTGIAANASADNVPTDTRNSGWRVYALNIATRKVRVLGEIDGEAAARGDVQIAPDGKYVAWATRGQLWIAALSGANPAHALAIGRGAASQPRWSPTNKQLAFVSDRDSHAFVGVYSFASETTHWIDPSVFRDTLPRWSPDGSELAFIRLFGDGYSFTPGNAQPWAIRVWDVTSGQTASIWKSAKGIKGSYPWESDWDDGAFQFAGSHRIVFASQEDGWVHLYSIAASGGDSTLLTPGKFSISGSVAATPDREFLVFASNEGELERRHIWRVAINRAGATAITRGDSFEWSPVITGTGAIVYLRSTSTQPVMPGRLAADGHMNLSGSTMPAGYPSAQFVTPEDVVFKSLDGLKIHGQLFVPRGGASPYAGLIFIHGGPYRQALAGFHPMSAYSCMYAANQYLANRGFVVLSVNYRLSTMYGRAFREPAHAGPRGASEYQDVVAGAHYLQALPSVDPDRIGLWGASYGGYLTALGLARNSDIFKAGVDYAGVHDWTEHSLGLHHATAADRKIAYTASPIASIDSWKSPVLLAHADDDHDVHFEQTIDLVRRLRACGVPYELLVLPDEAHDLRRWQSWVNMISATSEFFERTLPANDERQVAPAAVRSPERKRSATPKSRPSGRSPQLPRRRAP